MSDPLLKWLNARQPDKDKPTVFTVLILCQYAKSLHVVKNLPFHLNSYIIN